MHTKAQVGAGMSDLCRNPSVPVVLLGVSEEAIQENGGVDVMKLAGAI